MHYIGVKDGKIEKEGKNKKASSFSYTQYTLSPSRCIRNLKILAQTGAEKSVTESLVREKEKWTNKGNLTN